MAGVRSGGGDTSAPPPASIRETGGVGVRDRFVGPALLRSADAEPADARLFSLRVGGMPGRSSIITIGVGLTELFRIRVTRSFVTGPFLENSSLELTSPTCLVQDTRHEQAKETQQEASPRRQRSTQRKQRPRYTSGVKSYNTHLAPSACLTADGTSQTAGTPSTTPCPPSHPPPLNPKACHGHPAERRAKPSPGTGHRHPDPTRFSTNLTPSHRQSTPPSSHPNRRSRRLPAVHPSRHVP